MIGNYLYYRHSKLKIIETRSTQSPQNFYPMLEEVGGVHRWVVSFGVVIMVLITMLFALFFSTMIAFVGSQMTRMTI
jgi:hypothetical protein